MLAAVADEQHPGLSRRLAAVGAALERLLPDRRVGQVAGLPVRPGHRPGHDVLEPAEDREAASGGLGRAVAVVGVDAGPAPGAPQAGHRRDLIGCAGTWPTASRSRSWKATRRDRSSWTSPFACSMPTSSASPSSWTATTSRWTTAARQRT